MRLLILFKKAKKPVVFVTIIILIFYILSLIFWIDKFDWETASYITVFYGVIGVFFSLWQASAQKAEQKKDIIMLELSVSEEIANCTLLKIGIDEISNDYNDIYSHLREGMYIVNKVSLFITKELFDFNELYLICGNDIKGIVIRCIKIISDFDYEIEFISKDYILKYRDGLIDLYNRIKKIDTDILLMQSKIDYIVKMKPNRLLIK
jgi:hypothetical protein